MLLYFEFYFVEEGKKKPAPANLLCGWYVITWLSKTIHNYPFHMSTLKQARILCPCMFPFGAFSCTWHIYKCILISRFCGVALSDSIFCFLAQIVSILMFNVSIGHNSYVDKLSYGFHIIDMHSIFWTEECRQFLETHGHGGMWRQLFVFTLHPSILLSRNRSSFPS